MERLSSGLRINRAGDDAAGLAISEKMRAQVRGLNQASRNSQDAISLIQTAEGGLSETHNILQRMRELATQAANDTNVDVDRNEIQKEINQLTSEINRIGNTTEFNTQKLLTGDIGITGDGRVIASGATYGSGLSGLDVDPTSTLDTGSYEIAISESSVNQVGGGQSTTLPAGANTNVTGSDVSLVEGSYQVEITNDTAKALTVGPAGDVGLLNTVGGNEAISIQKNSNLANEAHSIDVTKTVTKSETPISADGITLIDGSAAEAGTFVIETAVVLDDTKITGATAGGEIMETGSEALSNFEIAADSTMLGADDWSIKVLGDDTLQTAADEVVLTFQLVRETGGAGEAITETVTASFTNTAGAKTIQLGDISFDVNQAAVYGSSADPTDGDVGSSFHDNVLTFGADSIQNQISVTYDGDTANKVTQTFDQTGDDGAKTFDMSAAGGGTLGLTYTGSAFVGDRQHTTFVQEETTYTIQLKNAADDAVGDSVILSAAQIADPANITNIALGDAGSGLFVDFDNAGLVAMGAGDTDNITFTVGEESRNIAQLKNADGTDLATPAGEFTLTNAGGTTVVNLGEGVSFSYEGDNLGTAGGSHFFSVKGGVSVWEASLTKVGDGLVGSAETFTRGETVTFGTTGLSIDTGITVADGAQATFDITDSTVDKSLSMQVGANKGQSFSVDVSDMRALALGISGDTTSGTANGVDEYAAGASFVDTKNVTNGTTSVTEEYALDVSDHTKATAAVEVLNQAIERVSAERSKLGAFQNRLEHTIANLGTSSENMQAAESRIRDLDMAQEMMDFTKNNILSQAATAMLAQANMAPQSVLQLLG